METDLDIFLQTTNIDVSSLPDTLQQEIRFKKRRDFSKGLIQKIVKYVPPNLEYDLDRFLATIKDDMKYLTPKYLCEIKYKTDRVNSKQLINKISKAINTAKYKEKYKVQSEKECNLCHKVKPIEQFGIKSGRTDNRNSNCKQCRREYSRRVRGLDII
jgi:hypothetical protein